MRSWAAVLLFLSGASTFAAQSRSVEFALILEDPPVTALSSGRLSMTSAGAASRRAEIRQKQASLRQQLEAGHFRITGAVNTLVNAVFVQASADRFTELRQFPGVKAVAMLPRMHRTLNRALDLVNVPNAWTALGGAGKAGAGVKIGVIDSGIDQTHPGFQDSSLATPAGYPIGDANYTTNKVIVARSYVSFLTSSDPASSSPDDYSPRDRIGHGTAMAMIAAGVTNNAPLARIGGVAPKAWLGNYKIFGSPGVNLETTTGTLVQALEDAFNDGMDVVVLGLGSPAVYGALDESGNCQPAKFKSYIPSDACDVRGQAVEHASQGGMAVVISAGNDGSSGTVYPTLGTINSPGTAPDAITVGSTTNSHILYNRVTLDNNGGKQTFNSLNGDGPKLTRDLTGQLVDVTGLGDDGNACNQLPANSLQGKIAFITRGTCDFYLKVDYAQDAGAIAVLMYDPLSDSIFRPTYLLNETAIPLAFIGKTDGGTVKAALKSNPSASATLSAQLRETDAAPDQISQTSSRGPSIGNMAIKPELVAVGTDLYTATQNYDPNGDVFDVSRYNTVEGSSFAAALVAGAAALVKQANPAFGAQDVKSALVNTASSGVVLDGSVPARVTAVGAGKLNAAPAVTTNATMYPSVLSFGQIGNSLPAAQKLAVKNFSGSGIALTFSVAPRDTDNNARVTISPSTLSLGPGQSGTVSVQLTGRAPSAGSYEGAVNISGASVPLHVPYLYTVADGRPSSIFPVLGDNFFGLVNEYQELIGFRMTDQYGAPIVGAPIQWGTVYGSGGIDYSTGVDAQTDAYGIGAAYVQLGKTPGDNTFQGSAGGLGWQFYQLSNYSPNITGIVNSGSFQTGAAVSPGSYSSAFGTDLAPTSIAFGTPYLPLALGDVAVSLDVASAGLSVAAPVIYVSPTMVNFQVPWELAGQSSATVKVTYHGLPSATYTLPLNQYSPAFFEFNDSTNGKLAAAALDANYQLITGSHPAVRGQTIALYANGLGPVTNPQPTGVAAPTSPLSTTQTQPTVTVGGQPAQVAFSSVAPGYVGLYQINVIVPSNAPTGVQAVTLSVNGVAAKSSLLAIQ